MIRSFASRDTARLFNRETLRRFPSSLQRAMLRKLVVLDAAETLDDLRVPPGNHLEKLTGDRVGQYSIRVNSQWRLCFEWHDGDAYDVELVDYH
jgi:proteic killer suppression protein